MDLSPFTLGLIMGGYSVLCGFCFRPWVAGPLAIAGTLAVRFFVGV
jgi:hypothetical protein